MKIRLTAGSHALFWPGVLAGGHVALVDVSADFYNAQAGAPAYCPVTLFLFYLLELER
jgi:hypothetical protein